MKMILGILLFVCVSVFAKDFKAGEFDYYVLALSWEPAFCEGKALGGKGVPGECHKQHDDDYDARNFVLHGLWPNVRGDKRHAYGYCGIPSEIEKIDTPDTRCDLPKLKISDAVRKELEKTMPGTQSCLQRHEWYRHGSCAGMDVDSYYKTSNFLVEGFSYSAFSEYVTQNIGESIDTYVLKYKFEKEFGMDSSKHLSLICKKIGKKHYLTEVRIAMQKDLSNLNSYEAWLPKSDTDLWSGNCKGDVYIDKAGIGR